MDHPSPLLYENHSYIYMCVCVRVCVWLMLCLVLHATSSSWCHALDASTLLRLRCHHRIIVSPTIPRPLQQALRSHFLSLIYNQISIFVLQTYTPYTPCPYSLCTPIYINLFLLPPHHITEDLNCRTAAWYLHCITIDLTGTNATIITAIHHVMWCLFYLVVMVTC